MNEQYRGTADDVAFIKNYLATARASDERSYLGVLRNVPLARVLADSSGHGMVDVTAFRDVCGYASAALRCRAHEFILLDENRFFVGVREPSDRRPGGFHDPDARGFQYIHNAGRVVAPTAIQMPHLGIRTLEIVRCYLHDSIHAASFRTFRRVPEGVSGRFPIYREQYGFNFRRPSGISYSHPRLTDQVPHAINLNVLMDGLNAIIVSELLRPWVGAFVRAEVSPLEAEALAEIVGQRVAHRRGSWFFESVVRPTRRFLIYWGEEPLKQLLFAAMMSGKMANLCAYFDSALGARGAWKRLFMSRRWKRPMASGPLSAL
jgi:hypothetical protein